MVRPVIHTTTDSPVYLPAQSRLALFIDRLQTGRRAAAAELFSTRVTPAERRAFMENRWLPADDANHRNFTQVLFWKNLDLYNGTVYRDGVKLQVVRHLAFRPTKNHVVTGMLEVPMRKEPGGWRVELHPPKSGHVEWKGR